MIGVAAARAVPADAALCELGHVLAGAMPGGQATRLAQMLDPAFLAEAGWDPDRRVLSLPAGHRLLGRAVCRVDGCATTAQPVAGVCFGCRTRLTGQGLSAGQITQASLLPPLPARAAECAVPGREGKPVTYAAVAHAAGVSRTWLYSQDQIRDLISDLRKDEPPAAALTAQRASTSSLRQRLDTACAEITRLRTENRSLRDQLARQLGLHRMQSASKAPAEPQ